jgi:hypothetical protein
MDDLHKQHIKESYIATKNRRTQQIVLVIDTKIDWRRCNGLQKTFCNISFVEQKRLYNYLLDLTHYVDDE